jgi:hypothetical protein
MRAHWLIGFAALLTLGCGSKSQKYAPVSGKVTINGAPLGGATVTFSPIAAEGTVYAGFSAVATTNDKGAYTLNTTAANGKQIDGVLVGKHRVSIVKLDPSIGDNDERHPGRKFLGDHVPRRYNTDSKEVFEVTPDGTDKADFKLTSP